MPWPGQPAQPTVQHTRRAVQHACGTGRWPSTGLAVRHDCTQGPVQHARRAGQRALLARQVGSPGPWLARAACMACRVGGFSGPLACQASVHGLPDREVHQVVCLPGLHGQRARLARQGGSPGDLLARPARPACTACRVGGFPGPLACQASVHGLPDREVHQAVCLPGLQGQRARLAKQRGSLGALLARRARPACTACQARRFTGGLAWHARRHGVRGELCCQSMVLSIHWAGRPMSSAACLVCWPVCKACWPACPAHSMLARRLACTHGHPPPLPLVP